MRLLSAFVLVLLLTILVACGNTTNASPSIQVKTFNSTATPSAASQEQVQKAYVAYYGRPADSGGLAYWAGLLDASGGNWSPIIEAFGNSAEATTLLVGLTNEQKIDKLYNQMFGRNADAAGRTFYANGLSSGIFTLASLAVNIINGAQTGPDAVAVTSKLTSAQLFTNSLDTDIKAAAYNATTLSSVQNWLATITTIAAPQASVDTLVNSITPPTGWIQTNLNPGMGRSLYATDTELYAATYQGIYSTASDGMPWFSKGPADVDVVDIIKSGQYLLAANYRGIYRSTDNGTTWQLASGSPLMTGGGGIYGPHVFAKNSSFLYAIAWAQGLFRSGDNGATWQQMYIGQGCVGCQDYAASATCISTADEKIIIGVGSRLYVSSDNGTSWVRSDLPAGDVRSLYYTNGKLYAGGSMGVYLSADYGSSWATQYSNTIDAYGRLQGLGTFRDIIAYNNKLIAAVEFKSIYISSDDGKSWASFSEGLISDWTFLSLAIKSPYLWAIRDAFGNAYRRPLSDI